MSLETIVGSALPFVVLSIAYVLGKQNFKEIPDLFEGITRARKGETAGAEVFVRGITRSDKLGIAYKAFGGRRYWFYHWFGELSVALLYILLIGTFITPKKFVILLLVFFLIRFVALLKYLSGYRLSKRLDMAFWSSFFFYGHRVIVYWLVLWAILSATDQLTDKSIRFENTLDTSLLVTSAQASFTVAAGLLIVLSLRNYFQHLNERREKVSKDIMEKIASGDLDLPKAEENFVQNVAKIEEQMSKDIDEYLYLKNEIDSVSKLPEMAKYYAAFGIYFLLTLKGLQGPPLPDGLVFGLFILFIWITFSDIALTLKRGLTES